MEVPNEAERRANPTPCPCTLEWQQPDEQYKEGHEEHSIVISSVHEMTRLMVVGATLRP